MYFGVSSVFFLLVCMQAFDLVFIFFKLRTVTNYCDAFQGHLVESYRSNVDSYQKLDRFEGMVKVIEEFSPFAY